MGLDITFTTLHRYLLDAFDGGQLVRRAQSAVRQEIKRQTGETPVMREPEVPAELEGGRYGSYSVIHGLRLYACRIAGYTLDEAYQLPVRQIPLRKLGDTSKEVENDENGTDEDLEESEESSFERDWGVKLNTLIPLAKKRITPFPYMNLVCFSDAEGIYIPYRFPEPFIIDNANVGSSLHLRDEMEAVGKNLVEDLLAVMQHPNEEGEQFLLFVRQLWWGLFDPVEQSAKHRVSMAFT